MTEPIVSELLVKEPDFFDLVSVFAGKLPELVEELQTLYDQGRWETLQDRIHDLKGLGGGYGYPQLSDVANSIELVLLSKSPEQIPDQVNQLRMLTQRIQVGLGA